MSLFYVMNLSAAQKQRAPLREPFSSNGRGLLGCHPRFDIGQGTIDAGEHPLLAHQRHRGVDAGGLTQIGGGNVRWQAYSAAMRASIYAKARSMRASTRSLPTSAITASIAGDWPRPVTATRSGIPTLPMP